MTLYCHLHESRNCLSCAACRMKCTCPRFFPVGCQVDHVISEKHGGTTIESNLAYACAFCNRSKGTDIGSVLPQEGEFLRFYNSRVDRWADHFRVENRGLQLLRRNDDSYTRARGPPHPPRNADRSTRAAHLSLSRASLCTLKIEPVVRFWLITPRIRRRWTRLYVKNGMWPYFNRRSPGSHVAYCPLRLNLRLYQVSGHKW
jgi:hypothetical protein